MSGPDAGIGKALARLEDQIGRPELPTFGEPGRRRQVLGSPCGAPASAQAARMAISA